MPILNGQDVDNPIVQAPLDSMVVTSGFGGRTNLITDVGSAGFHPGLDLRGATGTPVYAPFDGVVQTSVSTSGGNGIFITQPGTDWQTRMFHFSQVLVENGQNVLPGDLIGLVGATGQVTGPHLHFELRTPGDHNAIDPTDWLSSIGGSTNTALAVAGGFLAVLAGVYWWVKRRRRSA